MPIAPAAPQGQPANVSTQQSAAPAQQSFRERKMADLGSERPPEVRERREPAPMQDRPRPTPSRDVESTEDQIQDIPQDLAGDEYEDEESGYYDEDPEEGTPSDVGSDEDPREGGEWEKRYKDLQRQFTQLSQERGEMTQEVTETMTEALRLKFDLEDRFEEAVGRAEYMANIMSGNANQFRNINWAAVPPEHLPALQQQAQQALAMEQQSKAAWEEVKRRKDEALTHVKQREAAIAKTRLKRTIGLNNEVYGSLREHAVRLGMAPQEFNQITNPVIIEALHAQMTMMNAGNSVRTKNKGKAQVPRGRNAAQAPRDARGKFARTDLEPNRKGSFAEKHRHRLAMERQGR